MKSSPTLALALALALAACRTVSPATTGSEADAAQRPAVTADVIASARATLAEQRGDDVEIIAVSAEGGQALGPADALVTLVVYTDYQCPFCKRLEATLDQLVAQYGDDLRIVFKSHPLPFHQQAHLAHQAAEAAAAQGAFPAYHARLFANQRALEKEDLVAYAAELGLDAERLRAELEAGTYRAVVDGHMREAQALGARGVPATFVNGRYVRGAQPLRVFTDTVDAALAEAKLLVELGVQPAWIHEVAVADGAAVIPEAAPATARAPAPGDDTPVEVRIDGPARGPADAKITLVVFSEFQCPFCGRLAPTLDRLEEKYGDDLRIVHAHLPLPFHQRARPAALAAEAAGAQGAFWPYADVLYRNRTALEDADLVRYARDLGLDMARFEADLAAGVGAERIAAHEQEARRIEARGTPTSFVNGRRINGAQPYEKFVEVIDAALAAAE